MILDLLMAAAGSSSGPAPSSYIVTTATAFSEGTTDVNMLCPIGVLPGDFLVALCSSSYGTITNFPSGWSTAGPNDYHGTLTIVEADSGFVPGVTNFLWATPGPGNIAVVLVVLRGTMAWDYLTGTAQNNTSLVPNVAPSISPSAPSVLLAWYYSNYPADVTRGFTAPAGMNSTASLFQLNCPTIYCFDQSVAAGATGDRTSTDTTGGSYAYQNQAILISHKLG